MDLPVFRRGLELVSAQLNKLSNSIRASTITSVIGGSLSCTPGGTTLVINQPPSTPGGASAVCPFSVTDISVPGAEGGQMTLKLNVLCEEITLFSAPGFECWPEGTSSAAPNFQISGIPAVAGWYAIYLQINMDEQQHLVVNSAGRVLPKIVKLQNYAESTSTEQMVYLAGVTLSTDEANHIYISEISNACPTITLPALPTCQFLVEKNSPNFPQFLLKINIRSGRIAGEYPTGMDGASVYSLTVPDTANYWYVMCVLVVSDGQIQTGVNDVTFELFDSIKTSTDTLTYFLIAELQTGNDESNARVVEWLYNYCTTPFSIVRNACPFRITNQSAGELQQVEVAAGLVNGMVPKGMPTPPATSPPLFLQITQKSFIYCVITYDPTSFAITSGDDIEFKTFSTTKLNTALVEYILAGVVDWHADTGRIKSISSICQNITPNPCALKWDTPA